SSAGWCSPSSSSAPTPTYRSASGSTDAEKQCDRLLHGASPEVETVINDLSQLEVVNGRRRHLPSVTSSTIGWPPRTPGNGHWRATPAPARRRTRTSGAPAAMRRCWSPRERTTGGRLLRGGAAAALGWQSPSPSAPG